MSTQATPQPDDNPFSAPLQSEGGQAAPQQAASQPSDNPFDVPLQSEQNASAGQVTNDVGNTVIVPKNGEPFADTMKRAANQGGKTTQPQIDAEMATAPRKATEVLGAAPVIGAVGAAAPVAASASRVAIMNYLASQSPQLFGHEAVAETLKRFALQGLQKAGYGAAFAGGAELLHSVWDEVFGKKK
ncbi:MAG TPA: hypothetical protein VHV29_09980 [Terriglobales bacterium]|jgi:hypothetical protein|nr:hypothetical protein [Terriglobales bacterium]